VTPEEFRAAGHQLVDWISSYLDTVGSLPVAPDLQPGAVRVALADLDVGGEVPWAAIFDDFQRAIVPGLTHWQHPRFFAYFPANTSYLAILGELLSAGLGVNGMLWATSPAATELETLALDQLADLLDLPANFRSTGPGGGVIQGSASEATLCALLAARERATEGRANAVGAHGVDVKLVCYATAQTHSSLVKAARIAGIGSGNVREVATDETWAMRPDALARAVREDRAAGRLPFFVCATRGTTSSMAFDPVPEIAAVCTAENVWLHVDAAMSGTAALCPEYRWVNDGLGHADSYCTNPHKWVGVVFDCDALWVADRAALTGALSVLPEYLRTPQTGAVIDYRDWQVPLGRRFRALKLWFVLRAGIPEAQAMIRRHVGLTQEFAGRLAADARFEVVAPHPLSLVCFAHRGGNDATRALLESVNATGRVLLSHTLLGGRYVIRVSIGGRTTDAESVAELWSLLDGQAATLAAS
jgi:aromatic-L-amino-acid decarboxylase